jgi:hypothetical protein
VIVVQSTFPLPAGTTAEDFRTSMLETVPRYQGVTGLLHKCYVHDAARHQGGGIYLFDTRAHAEQCFSPDMVARATARFGAFELQWFECPIAIDNVGNRVHR